MRIVFIFCLAFLFNSCFSSSESERQNERIKRLEKRVDSLLRVDHPGDTLSEEQVSNSVVSYDALKQTDRCKARTKKGSQCRRAAKKGGHCWQHAARTDEQTNKEQTK